MNNKLFGHACQILMIWDLFGIACSPHIQQASSQTLKTGRPEGMFFHKIIRD